MTKEICFFPHSIDLLLSSSDRPRSLIPPVPNTDNKILALDGGVGVVHSEGEALFTSNELEILLILVNSEFDTTSIFKHQELKQLQKKLLNLLDDDIPPSFKEGV